MLSKWKVRMRLRAALVRVVREPGYALEVGLSIARGHYYRVKFRLLGRRVVIGRRFRVTGPLDIRGPGTVIFGDDCAVISSRTQRTTPWTHHPEAVIRFGNRVLLTGTRFGCAQRIEVGDDVGLSDARIMDTDFHSPAINSGNRANSAGASKPIHIGRGVWVGAGAFLLKGVRIGENAVVSAASVVVGDVPPNAIVLGNPARVTWRLRPPAATPAATPPVEAPATGVPTSSPTPERPALV